MVNEEMKIVIFDLNGEKYATEISNVERICGYEEPTELPDAPSFVKGVINYEGNILPVISLYDKFNFGKEIFNEDKKIIIVRKAVQGYGIIVDNVSEVKSIKNSDFEEAPSIAVTVSKRYINGLVKLNGDIIILLDLGKILTEGEEELL